MSLDFFCNFPTTECDIVPSQWFLVSVLKIARLEHLITYVKTLSILSDNMIQHHIFVVLILQNGFPPSKQIIEQSGEAQMSPKMPLRNTLSY